MAEKINPIYSGKKEDFHWVGFGSGSGTNLRECAKVIKPALVFSDRPKAKLLRLEELTDVPKEIINGYEACGSWKKAQGNTDAEREYRKRSDDFNMQVVDMLHRHEDAAGHGIDLIVLGGYMRLVGEPLLVAYADRMINVHPADLGDVLLYDEGLLLDGFGRFEWRILNDKWGIDCKGIEAKRKYVGEDAVYDAIKAGEKLTRSSVIMVDSGVDHGEILIQGPVLTVWDGYITGTDREKAECLRQYADAHQSMQKVRSDWPALTKALELIANGRLALGTEKVHLDEWRAVYLDGKGLPYEGVQLD